jgi:hypothetical protein
MLRDDHTIWTAIALDAVFTSRTYATRLSALIYVSADNHRRLRATA